MKRTKIVYLGQNNKHSFIVFLISHQLKRTKTYTFFPFSFSFASQIVRKLRVFEEN